MPMTRKQYTIYVPDNKKAASRERVAFAQYRDESGARAVVVGDPCRLNPAPSITQARKPLRQNPYVGLPAHTAVLVAESVFRAPLTPSQDAAFTVLEQDEHHFGEYIAMPCASLTAWLTLALSSDVTDGEDVDYMGLADRARDAMNAGFTHLVYGI